MARTSLEAKRKTLDLLMTPGRPIYEIATARFAQDRPTRTADAAAVAAESKATAGERAEGYAKAMLWIR